MKRINIPKKDEKLAEFLGTCFGDGCICEDKKNHTYSLFITGHLIDDELYIKNYLPQTIKSLFDIDSKIIKQEGNTLILYVRSKELVQFLNGTGMQIGKKNALKIPAWIRSDASLMRAFLRGFADTDGSLTFKKRYKNLHYYPTISISSVNKNLIDVSRKFLVNNGFKSGKVVKTMDKISGSSKNYPHYRLFLYGENNLEKWLELIGFSNMKHKSKYLVWKKLGYSPPYSITENRIKIIKNPLNEI